MDYGAGGLIKHFFSIPNIISFSRILGSFFFLFLFEKNYRLFAIILFFYLALSDFLDGFLARKFNQESTIGKILDPLADKICLGSILIYFGIKGWWPFWIIMVIFGRDIIQILFFIIFFKKVKFSISPSLISKINTGVIFFTILFFLLGKNSYFFSYANICWSIIAFLTIWSGVDYGKKFFSSLH